MTMLRVAQSILSSYRLAPITEAPRCVATLDLVDALIDCKAFIVLKRVLAARMITYII